MPYIFAINTTIHPNNEIAVRMRKLFILLPFPVFYYWTTVSGLSMQILVYKKRGELLSAIASRKNFINLLSATIVTVFAHHLVHVYKFRIIQKTAR